MAFDFRYVTAALPALFWGATVTLEMSVLAVLLGLMVGIILTVGRQARIRLVDWLAETYISFVRGTPLFVQILLVYYALPAVGLDLPRFYAGVIALSLNSGAYISEMLRGGFTSLSRGQIEAAKALGMPRWLIWQHLVLPQVLMLVLPPLTAEFTGLVKASALLSVIAVVELTRTGQQIIASTFRPVEIWVTVGALYFVICFGLASVTRRLERLALVFRP